MEPIRLRDNGMIEEEVNREKKQKLNPLQLKWNWSLRDVG